MSDAGTEIAWQHSLEAEQSVLGALLLDNHVLARIESALAASDFFVEAHRAIYTAIVKLVRAGDVADIVTVTELLQRVDAEAFASYGAVYVAQLAQNTPGPGNAWRYAELVGEKALCRRLDALAQELARAARTPGGRNARALITEARARISTLAEAAAPSQQLRADSAADFLGLELRPLEPLLTPWLFQKNLAMVHARRGVGKTHFALACAYAVASGSRFLGWQAPKAAPVLYVDGEMPAQLMQQRLRELASGAGEIPDTLRLITPDRQDRPMPDLATAAGQAELDELIDGAALVILDNLSCLVRSGGAENEAESWTGVSEWLLKHRRAGRAVWLIHHSGKTGAQRGTSKREDLLDVVINLRRPPEYEETEGAAFDVYFEKARSLTGNDIDPVRAKLEQLPGGGTEWRHGPVESATRNRIVALWEEGGLTMPEIAQQLGTHKSHAHRTLELAMKAGTLNREYPARRKKVAA